MNRHFLLKQFLVQLTQHVSVRVKKVLFIQLVAPSKMKENMKKKIRIVSTDIARILCLILGFLSPYIIMCLRIGFEADSSLETNTFLFFSFY